MSIDVLITQPRRSGVGAMLDTILKTREISQKKNHRRTLMLSARRRRRRLRNSALFIQRRSAFFSPFSGRYKLIMNKN